MLRPGIGIIPHDCTASRKAKGRKRILDHSVTLKGQRGGIQPINSGSNSLERKVVGGGDPKYDQKLLKTSKPHWSLGWRERDFKQARMRIWARHYRYIQQMGRQNRLAFSFKKDAPVHTTMGRRKACLSGDGLP